MTEDEARDVVRRASTSLARKRAAIAKNREPDICDHCGGSGVVPGINDGLHSFAAANGDVIECPVCNGTCVGS